MNQAKNFDFFSLLKRKQKEQKSVTVENSNQNKMAATKQRQLENRQNNEIKTNKARNTRNP